MANEFTDSSETEQPYDASDPKQVAERVRASKRRQKKEGAFLCKALKDAEGRSFFYDLLASCHIFSTPFTGDAFTSAFNMGAQNMGNRLYNQLMIADPKAFLQMLTEQGTANG